MKLAVKQETPATNARLPGNGMAILFANVEEAADKTKRILVVDDEQPNRELLEAILTGLGHDVDMAADGEAALAKLDASHDLVMLDVMMPGMDGFEVLTRIRSHSKCSDIPVCMVTALSGREQRLRAVEEGANDFISKPIDIAELKIRTASLLRIKEAQDSIREYRAKLEVQNQALQESMARLKKEGELKAEFVRIASHDLKNPLTCILGFATIVNQAVKPGMEMTGEAQQHLDRIINQVRKMEKIIKEFLEIQIVEDGRYQAVSEPTDLNEIVRLSEEQNSGYAQAKQITLTVEPYRDLPLVLADGSQISHVVDNFVSNAIKFGNQGGSVAIRTYQSEKHVLLEVIDDGPGIAEKELPMLFVKYAKLSNKPTGGESSTGLGLAICKKMIALNGGEIGARNNSSRGATFWFKLPLT